MFTHMHRAVPVTSFLGDSAQLESHTSQFPESKWQQEKRIRGGERTVRQASACKAPVGLAAEGGGGEGSDFLALGWLLGVGLSDYRGAGTQPAGMGIMRCLPKRWNPLEHRESYTVPAWKGAQRLITALEKAVWTFLSSHVGG